MSLRQAVIAFSSDLNCQLRIHKGVRMTNRIRKLDGKTRLKTAVLVDVDGTLAGIYRNGKRPLRSSAPGALKLLSEHAPVFLWSIVGAESVLKMQRGLFRNTRRFHRMCQDATARKLSPWILLIRCAVLMTNFREFASGSSLLPGDFDFGWQH